MVRPGRHQRAPSVGGQASPPRMMSRSEATSRDSKPKEGWHGIEDRDGGGIEDVRQGVGLAQHLAGRHKEAGTDEIRDPDLLHGKIERDRSALEHDIGGTDGVERIGRAQVVADVAARDHDALGHARGTRRVDQIGGVVGPGTESAGIDRCQRTEIGA